jgi:hypothetical protein
MTINQGHLNPLNQLRELTQLVVGRKIVTLLNHFIRPTSFSFAFLAASVSG